MKKVLYVFVAIIGMLAITSCVDRQQCVGNWVSDSVTDEGFTGKFYLDLRENGTAVLNIKGSGAVEEEGMNIKVGVSAKISGKWDVSMGFMDLELDSDKVKCSIDNISTGNKSIDALIQLFLNDPEAKKQMVEEFKRELNVNDFNGSLEVEFDGCNFQFAILRGHQQDDSEESSAQNSSLRRELRRCVLLALGAWPL